MYPADKFGDFTRGLMHKMDGIVDGVAIGAVKRVLVVTYECCQGLTPEGLTAPDPEPRVYLPRVRALLSRLEAHGQLRELHSDDGEYTYRAAPTINPVVLHPKLGGSLRLPCRSPCSPPRCATHSPSRDARLGGIS